MKRFFAFLLLITTLLSLFACRQNTVTGEIYNDDYTDNYLYQKIDGVYCRINVDTGATSPLCPDPLCSHDNKDCPFYNMGGNPFFFGRYVYFQSGYSGESWFTGHTALRRFDLSTGEYTDVYRTDGSYLNSNFHAAGDYIQFCVETVKDNKTGFFIMLHDRKSGQTRQLNTEPTTVPHQLNTARDGRLYWSTHSGERYSTDKDYKDRRDGDIAHSDPGNDENNALILDNLPYMKGEKETLLPVYRLSLYDYETEETRVIFEETPGYPFLYKDNIFYFKLQDSPPLLGYERDKDSNEKRPVYQKRGGKLYICNRDGSEERLLLDISGQMFCFAEITHMEGKVGAGDWIGVRLYSYEQQEDGTVKRADNRLMLVNIITGESKLVSEDQNANT